MTAKKKPEPDDAEQSARFVEVATALAHSDQAIGRLPKNFSNAINVILKPLAKKRAQPAKK